MIIVRSLCKYATLFSIVFLPLFVHAATLSVAPSSTSVQVGSTLSIYIVVDSEGVAINNAEGTLSFPRDLFDVVSVNKDVSLFTLWIDAPTYDGNSSISFNGGLPSPGYQGSNGRLFTVTLRAKAAGSGVLSLANGAVRANDGLGTNVMRVSNNASITVVQSAPTAPTQPTQQPSGAFLGALDISSPTHPSQDAWYSATEVIFNWTLPAGADSVQTGLSKTKGATPTTTSRPAVSQKTVSGLEEGVSYFNLRAHTASGWSPVSSYTLQIDTTPPVVSGIHITYDPDSNTLELSAASIDAFDLPKKTISLKGAASDALSGLAKVEVLIDGSVVATLNQNDLDAHTYTVPVTLSVGSHSAVVRATDRAGNSAKSAQLDFAVERQSTFGETLRAKLHGLDITLLLLILTLLLSCFSVGMNFVLWRKLRQYESHESAHVRATKQHDRR